MDRVAVIIRLTELPGEIEGRENDLLDAQEDLNKFKEGLIDQQNALLESGAIDGKNAELRSAQMRNLTNKERVEVAEAENVVAAARINLNRAVNQFKAYRAVAKLLDQGVE
jgi:hypothetical protein